jgi:hypothetical protein
VKLHWRNLFRPEVLFLIGAVQANLPYIFWHYGYEMPAAYRFTVSYVPLCLWFIGYMAFWLGVKSLPVFLLKKRALFKSETRFCVNRSLFRSCIVSLIVLCLIQTILAIKLYGIIPIIGYFSGYDVVTLNLRQHMSGFGQLGLLILATVALNAMILVGVIADIKGWNKRDRHLLYVALVVSVFSAVFQGKLQGFFILAFMIVAGSSLIKAHPFNPILGRLGFRTLSRRQTYLRMAVLFVILFVLHGFTRSLRVGHYKEFGITSAVDSVVMYLSWPLMNMENQISISGWRGLQFDLRGLLIGLFPYKMQADLLTHWNVSQLPLLEPTASSGFLGSIHWNLGLWGMLVFCFFIGGLCEYFYINSRKSLFCLLMYAQIVWTLIAAHTYNHFLNLLFIPAPAIVFFILTMVIGARRMPSKACARELICT